MGNAAGVHPRWLGLPLGLTVGLLLHMTGCWLLWNVPPVRQAVIALDEHRHLLAGGLLLLIGLAGWWPTLRRAQHERLGGWSSHPWRAGWCNGILLALCTLLFTVPLLTAWTKLTPFYSALLAGLPFSDAYNYLDGALVLEHTGALPAWNQRRPLTTLLLAARLWLAQGDYALALVQQAWLVGAAVFILARTVARDTLPLAGAAVALGWYAVAGRNLVWCNLSEPVGLLLGLLATALLWRGTVDRRLGTALMGLGVLAVGLNARAGAFFVLPLLVLWLSAGWRGRRRRMLAVGAAALAVLVGALLLEAVWRGVYGAGVAAGQGNFALTFYGLATGQPGWERIYADYPEARNWPEPQINALAWTKAWEQVRAAPLDLARGLGRGAMLALRDLLGSPAHGLLLLLAAAASWRFWRQRWFGVVGVTWLGMALSAPIIYPDGGIRVFVTTLPLAVLPLLVFGAAPQGVSEPPRASVDPWAGVTPAVALTLALLAGALALPALLVRQSVWRGANHVAAGTDGTQLLAVVGPGNPQVRVLPAGGGEPTLFPTVRAEDYAAQRDAHPAVSLPAVAADAPAVLMIAFSPVPPGGTWWLLGSADLPGDRARVVRLRGRAEVEGPIRWFFVDEVETLERGKE